MLGLLERSFEYKRIRSKVWYAPILLLMPSVMVLSYGLMRLIGVPLPTPQFPVLEVLALLLVFFIAALGEELGWSGYVLDPMQDRWGALRAGILLGLVWAAWHIIPLLQAHRSPAWIAWWCLGTVTMRVLMVWLYNNTRQERLRRGPLPHHDQRQLATFSDPRFILRPACHRLDHDCCGCNRHSRMGAAHVSSAQKCLTGWPRCISFLSDGCLPSVSMGTSSGFGVTFGIAATARRRNDDSGGGTGES